MGFVAHYLEDPFIRSVRTRKMTHTHTNLSESLVTPTTSEAPDVKPVMKMTRRKKRSFTEHRELMANRTLSQMEKFQANFEKMIPVMISCMEAATKAFNAYSESMKPLEFQHVLFDATSQEIITETPQ